MSEKVEEKKVEQPSSPPPQAGPKAPVWPRILKVWTGLIGISWGATIAHALSQTSWLGASTIVISRMKSTQAPLEALSPGAIGAGAVVAVGIIVLLNRKFGKLFAWSKPGQGAAVRGTALVTLGTLAGFGCTAFYLLPPSTSSWWASVLWTAEILGKVFSVRPILFPAAGILTTVMFAIYLLLNREKWAEFLVETEGELKKVSWPARKEYVGSASVVVLVVAIISLFLYFVDHLMSKGFSWAKIGF
ncbi:MAG TPA: preprotein translocase subunit SecE [Planctomycetota bacterium]|nr:preprotein translocase subunit SecE [Planctomycetota bacterium]